MRFDEYLEAALTNNPVPRERQRSPVVVSAREGGFNIASVMQYSHDDDAIRRNGEPDFVEVGCRTGCDSN